MAALRLSYTLLFAGRKLEKRHVLSVWKGQVLSSEILKMVCIYTVFIFARVYCFPLFSIPHIASMISVFSDEERQFTFDYSWNSFVPRDHPSYASQSIVWQQVGVGVLENAYAGYNCSLFAYGQTGSGKSYSMMGYGEDKGIIPIACEQIFKRIAENTDPNLTIRVEASMYVTYDLISSQLLPFHLPLPFHIQDGDLYGKSKRFVCSEKW